jgi:hypothetical protein
VCDHFCWRRLNNRRRGPARYEAHQFAGQSKDGVGFAPHVDCHLQARDSLFLKVHMLPSRRLEQIQFNLKKDSIDASEKLGDGRKDYSTKIFPANYPDACATTAPQIEPHKRP